MDLMRVGLDVGSTTLKCVVLGADNELLHAVYQRHNSDIGATILAILASAAEVFGKQPIAVAMAGSGALDMARRLGLEYVQEVMAASLAVRTFIPDAEAVVEIGGEDAKSIVLLKNGSERDRMNDSCAAGTGAFIDQMATLMKTDAVGLNNLAMQAEEPAHISARCGVFAKSDIQPLLNSDRPVGDIAAGVYRAIASQTIGQLAQGDLKPGQHIVLLGGPLRFSSELRKAFEMHPRLAGAKFTCPENAEYYVAMGAALSAQSETCTSFGELAQKISELAPEKDALKYLPPLFKDEAELAEFRRKNPKIVNSGRAMEKGDRIYVGIDAGSTTRKVVFIDDDGNIVWSEYQYNDGSVMSFGERIARVMYERDLNVAHTVAIGYGEDMLVKSGWATSGEVETMAHLRAAQELYDDIDFVVDIGGQDVKVFEFDGEQLVDLQLNEACSSGCGSFLKTYADSLGLTPERFDELACTAKHPIDLGTRCTVFMGSNVKNAQRHGAELADIAAGLQYSVVNNLLDKVVKKKLHGRIVAQGGTLWNDGVYRALQLVTGAEVLRPEMSGLMGAYGAALLARDRAKGARWHKAESTNLNMVDFKLELLLRYKSEDYHEDLESVWGNKGVIGIPFALNMYEDYPFWCAFFGTLGFDVKLSQVSDKKTYERGVWSIFSGTVCYPAKLLHGHVVDLVEQGVKTIWLPFVKWTIPEDRAATNHYNCPVVMGYPYAAAANMREYLDENGVVFYSDPLPFDRPRKMLEVLAKHRLLKGFSERQLKAALANAEEAQKSFKMAIRIKGMQMLTQAREEGMRTFVLAGHPYHVDPEVNHDIAGLVNRQGVAVLTEDAVAHLVRTGKTNVSNQWVYHARLYAAAKWAARQSDVDFVQIVSFGCGLDAVTATEVKSILEAAHKPYTQLKVDDVRDLRPARIRIRSLLALLDR